MTATLCIIGGSPRSGTRNFADLANAHSEVRLFGEIGVHALASANDALAELQAYHKSEHARRAPKGRNTIQGFRDHEMALALLAMYAKSPAAPYNPNSFSSGVVGFKCPQIERRWRVLVDMFRGFEKPKHFFFCMRNLDENYLSLHSRGWRSNLGDYFNRLKPALEALLEFREWSVLQDEEWKISVLHLNDYLSSTDRADWLGERLFGHIAPGTSNKRINKFVAATTNRNATLAVTGEDRRRFLTEAERKTLEAAEDMRELLQKVNEIFDVNIGMLSENTASTKSA